MTAMISNTVRQFFAENDWEFHYNEEHNVFAAAYANGDESHILLFIPNDESETLSCRTMCGENVPAPYRAEVAEYLLRVNLKLVACNFKIDLSDGEVSLGMTGIYKDGRLSTQMVKQMVYFIANYIDHWGPGLALVASGKKTALVAFEESVQSNS